MKMPNPHHHLQEFFESWRGVFSREEKSNFTNNLAHFFQNFSNAYHHSLTSTPAPLPSPVTLDSQKLADFFTSLKNPLVASRHSAIAFNPLHVMDLGRNEVRVVKILCWLLEPHGSHGFGSAFLKGLLTEVVQPHFKDKNHFPIDICGQCAVDTETNPDGQGRDRVDIEVDSSNFHLIIEAKIDAFEQKGQLNSYCKKAQNVAKKRPWALIFLTPQGRKPSRADDQYLQNIILLSWSELSDIFYRHMKTHQTMRKNTSPHKQQYADFFIKTYLHHIHSFLRKK